jgi:DUF4097 and DUF4098 domain-containing protein YvlB
VSTINQEFTVGSGPALNIKIQAGRVDVAEGRPGAITIEVNTRDPDSIEIVQTGDTIYVSDNRSGWVVRGTVRITATVPARTDLEVGSASADVHADVELGSFICRTASGDVSFRSVDSLEVKTASGAVRGDRVDGDVRVNSASGDVWIERIGGRMTAALASGDVRSEDVGGDLRANSASGDLRIGRFRGDEVTMKSVSGDLVIGFPKGIRLDADVNTLSGHVHLPTPSSPEPQESLETPKRRVRLSAKTVSGDIRISTFSD